MSGVRRGRALVASVALATGAIVWLLASPTPVTGSPRTDSAASTIERLQERRVPADELPPHAVASLREHMVTAEARVVTAGGGARFFVAPGRHDGVCLVGAVILRRPVGDHKEDVALTCESLTSFTERGMYLSMGEHGAHHAVLLLPDVVEGVRLPDSAATLPVRGNAVRFGPFAYEVDPLDDHADVQYVDAELIVGDDTVEIPVPAAALGHVAGSGS